MKRSSTSWSGLGGELRHHDYIAALQQLADDEEFPFIDVTRGTTDQFALDADYSDDHHMRS